MVLLPRNHKPITLACLYFLANSPSNYCQTFSLSIALLPQLGISENGAATSAWRDAIRDRHEEDELAQLLAGTKKFSEEETHWAELIKSKVASWRGMIDSLRIPFENVTLPDTVSILPGNRSGSDAFIYSTVTICFDLSQLQQQYGVAASSVNHSRLDRFFAHEFTHVLHKA